MNRLASFLQHYFSSKSRHGVHSPFVFDLIDQCLYQQGGVDRKNFKSTKAQLIQNHQQLIGYDYGSEIHNDQIVYKVSELAKGSTLRKFEVDLLLRLSKYHQSNAFLELGTNIGLTALSLAKTNGQLNVTTVEGNSSICEFAKSLFEANSALNIKSINSTFSDYLANANETSFDMIFIDGDHKEKPTLENYQKCKSLLKGNGPIILHDIYWSKGMRNAWRKIISDPDATVTVDLYFFGLVYFRKGQEKQHFSIRFPRSVFQIL